MMPDLQYLLDIKHLGRRFPHQDGDEVFWIINYDGKFYVEDAEGGIGLIDPKHYHHFQGQK